MNHIIEAMRRSHNPKTEAKPPKMPGRAKELKQRAAQKTKKILDLFLPKLQVSEGQKMHIDLVDEAILSVALHRVLTEAEIDQDDLLNWKNRDGKKAGKTLLAAEFEKIQKAIFLDSSQTGGVPIGEQTLEDYLQEAQIAAEAIVNISRATSKGEIDPRQADWQFRTIAAYSLAQMRLARTGE